MRSPARPETTTSACGTCRASVSTGCGYLRICDILGQMYRYCDQSAWDVTEQLAITWGNGVPDPDKEWQQNVSCTHGISAAGDRPATGTICRENEEDWEKIRAKYMPDANGTLNEVERLRW
ncbi:MAG: hypothetical protein ACLR7U_05600 [Ruthenibacterium lactatiformans]